MIRFTDETIQHMVDRFLGWRLPENFNPDAGISFKATFNDHMPFGPMKHEPFGTNLFDATQAEEMVRYMVAGLPQEATSAQPDSHRPPRLKFTPPEGVDILRVNIDGLEFEASAHGGGCGGCSNRATSGGGGGASGFTTFAASGGGTAPSTRSPTFEPGKRYRTVGGDIATIDRRDDDPEVLFCLHGTIGRDPHLISSWQENGSYGHAGCNQAFDLVPGAIGETTDHTGPTDAQLAEALFDAYATAKSETAGWNAVASRARELLQGGDAVAAIRRAERAEAAVEAARRIIEATLLAETLNAYGRGCDEKSRQIAEAMGMTITPARDLTVTREGGK
jgi:hypothetical protein